MTPDAKPLGRAMLAEAVKAMPMGRATRCSFRGKADEEVKS